MLSELRTRKLTRYFNVLDTNHDGFFSADDSALIVSRLVAFRGLKPGTVEHDAFIERFGQYWHEVRCNIDASEDGKVSLAEWLHYHNLMLANPARFEASAATAARLIAGLLDANGDGEVTVAEYAAWLRAWGMVDDAEIDDVNRRIDINGDGLLSVDEIMSLIRDFFFSDDPDAPGNWAMGPF
ncbi:MAG: hypothetical protein KC420_01535 [Myxococcales bacterium]|nr:hypothetical protein [Myxococcales bacterium]MCB9567050.1 hypothetical protein [Myxococcales bacterium]MCB9704117.1 hypothetical protein [Myxococcales bacterium]